MGTGVHEWVEGLGEVQMKTSVIAGIALIVIGVAAFIYGGFNYKSQETVLQIGPLKATAETSKTVPIPQWAGIAAVLAGVVVIVLGSRK